MIPGPGSLLLQWHVTERCDHACRHCYQGEPPNDLPFETLLDILEQFRELVRHFREKPPHQRIPAHINVTGGEPFLRSDFFDLLQRFRELRREFSFAILSNGSRIDREVAARLKQFGPGFVQVSLEGTPQTHDSIRGSGDHARVVAAIRHLKKAGVPVMISFTAHRDNFREFPDVVSVGRKLGVNRVWSDRFVPIGGASTAGELVLSSAETDEWLKIMAGTRSKRTIFRRHTEFAMHRALQFRCGDGRPYRCLAGRELVTVMADGTLVPCRRMPVSAGSLLQESLLQLYLNTPLFVELRHDSVPDGCQGCFYARACQGGLRCLAHAVTGSYHQADPGCSLAGC